MDIVAFRRHLHAHPELSFREQATAAFISAQLAAAGIAHRTVAATGILARIEGRIPCDDRRAVVLRADIDALPIAEQTGLPYASQQPGIMHACGHDMHAAVLYGVLLRLAAAPDFCGTVFGLFQPGEECNPGGASLVLAENPFEGFDVRAVIGEHVEPQLEVGVLGFRAGKYMAASDELRFRVQGTGGHAALRSQLKDPVAASAGLVAALLALNTPERVLSIGRIEAAGATNVIPDEVRLEGTLRTFDEADRTAVHRRIAELASGIDSRHGVHTEVDISHGYPAVINDPELTRLAVARAAAMGLRTEMLPLRTTAEDFGFYSQRYPALFYRLGVGRAAGRPHTALFAPDERALDAGAEFMRTLALQILDKQ
ncbi:MAG: amidohydrolase [Alistipes sp.]|nr:amidohydrolase [Alistipes sp.]